MPPTVTDQFAAVHPQMLRGDGETARKKLVGRRVARAFELMGLTKQDAAFRMGYSDAGTVSRWCSGLERPHFDKLNVLDGFEDAYVLATAERHPRMEIVTHVRLRRMGAS